MLTLILLRPNKKPQRFKLDGETPEVIGRHAKRLKLEDSRVSRQHAEVLRQDGVWLLRDLGSSNGTRLNGERIDGERELDEGDEIRIGRQRLVVGHIARDLDATVVDLDADDDDGPDEVAGGPGAGPAAGLLDRRPAPQATGPEAEPDTPDRHPVAAPAAAEGIERPEPGGPDADEAAPPPVDPDAADDADEDDDLAPLSVVDLDDWGAGDDAARAAEPAASSSGLDGSGEAVALPPMPPRGDEGVDASVAEEPESPDDLDGLSFDFDDDDEGDDDPAPISLVDLDDDDADAVASDDEEELAPLSLADLDDAEELGGEAVDLGDDEADLEEPDDWLDDPQPDRPPVAQDPGRDSSAGSEESLPSGTGWDHAVLEHSHPDRDGDAIEDEAQHAEYGAQGGATGDPLEFVRMTAELPEPRDLRDPDEDEPVVGGPSWQPGGRESARRKKKKKRKLGWPLSLALLLVALGGGLGAYVYLVGTPAAITGWGDGPQRTTDDPDAPPPPVQDTPPTRGDTKAPVNDPPATARGIAATAGPAADEAPQPDRTGARRPFDDGPTLPGFQRAANPPLPGPVAAADPVEATSASTGNPQPPPPPAPTPRTTGNQATAQAAAAQATDEATERAQDAPPVAAAEPRVDPGSPDPSPAEAADEEAGGPVAATPSRPSDAEAIDASAAGDVPPAAAAGGRRIVFVVDASGSMVDSMSSGVNAWLRSHIASLAAADRFTVLFFRSGDVLEPPPTGLQPASEANRQRFLDWASPQAGNVQAGGRSEPVPAFERAAEYEADVIYLLSDNRFGQVEPGQPGVGVGELDRALSATSDPVVNAVQFYYRDPDNRLQQIASRFDGSYEFVDEAEFQEPPADLLGGLDPRQ